MTGEGAAGPPDDDDRGAPAIRARTLLAGIAVRPLAQSARRAGADAASVDLFGDRDHRRAVPVLSLRDVGADDYSARALVELSRRVEAGEVAYGADLENHPDQVARLAAGRRLLGNPPEVLRQVRDPFRLAAVLRGADLAVPSVRRHDDPPGPAAGAPAASGEAPGGWLRKPLRGGGGHGVRPWRPGDTVGEDAYVQQRIRGLPVGILFLADGTRARLLAATEMLVGRAAFGADGYAYCGSLLRLAAGRAGPPGAPAGRFPWGRARELAARLAADFGLRGLNGVDAVLSSDGTLWPVEVNPRWTASMELLEPGPGDLDAATGTTLFEAHRRACGGELPDTPVPSVPEILRRWARLGPGVDPVRGREAGDRPPVVGKAIVRTREAARAPDLESVSGPVLADVPEVGERIPAGGPVCTVLAAGRDRAACLGTLEDAGARVQVALRPAVG